MGTVTDTAARLHADNLLVRPGTVLLDTAFAGGKNRQVLLFSTPEKILTATTIDEVPDLLRKIDEAAAKGLYAAGYLNYEAGYVFERIGTADPGPLPFAWFGLYKKPEVLDAADLERMLEHHTGGYSVSDGSFCLNRAEYRAKIENIKSHIREGDVYQINFTAPYTFRFTGSPLSLYRTLRRRQSAGYAAWIYPGNATYILSLSPELFFSRSENRITVRPMKGTVRRGKTPAEDRELSQWMANDEKSRAENLMIVDLLRNDLSICCLPGSVRVTRLFETETYETLIQMTSTVEGELLESAHYADLFRALFPSGSVTGAPKIRAMQLIRELEIAPRGVYCGAIGFIAPDKRAVFNVAIRTVVLHEQRGMLGLGSGIVWDSDADTEYDECLLKSAFFTGTASEPRRTAFSLIETMLWDTEITLLNLHAARMSRSASALGFPFDKTTFFSLVQNKTAALEPGKRHKVRVLLDASGQFQISTEMLSDTAVMQRRVCLSPHRIDPDDPLLYHKTTRRQLYEAEYNHAVAAGYYDAIFLNIRGEVTEATRANIFIRKASQYLTPPTSSGLLPGVYRRHLLETLPHVTEQVLFLEDLRNADAVYLCNAVQGLQQVELVEAA